MARHVTHVGTHQVERPPLKKHDIKMLDLAFAMDCTGSMDSYINSARENICSIVDEIVASDKSDVRLALVEYRDHPPQDDSFVTKTHDFTGSPRKMREWLGGCSAIGGGDDPEAVADALHDVLNLSWREEATKICVCISDAPPHGLNVSEDGFPNGCPAGIDPMEVTNKMSAQGITLYMAGCEPYITPYKDFFMALAFITGGQYVPLDNAQCLTQVIVGGAQEEMSLEKLMQEVNEEAQADITAGRDIHEEEFTRRIHGKLLSKGIKTKQLRQNSMELQTATDVPQAMTVVNSSSMAEVRKHFKPTQTPMTQVSAKSGALHPVSAKSRMVPPVSAKSGVLQPVSAKSGMVPPVSAKSGVLQPVSAKSGMVPPVSAKSGMMPPGSTGIGKLTPRSAEDGSYSVMHEDISYAQSSRMVQKYMKRNFLK